MTDLQKHQAKKREGPWIFTTDVCTHEEKDTAFWFFPSNCYKQPQNVSLNAAALGQEQKKKIIVYSEYGK